MIKQIDNLAQSQDPALKAKLSSDQNWAESNIFSEEIFLDPSLAYLSEKNNQIQKIKIANLLPSGEDEQIAQTAFISNKTWRNLPIPNLEIWQSKLGFLRTPLLKINHEKEGVFRIVESFLNSPGKELAFYLPEVTWDGIFTKTLLELCKELKLNFFVTDHWQRAQLLVPEDRDPDRYLLNRFSKGRLGEYRRVWRRFSERGELKFEVLDNLKAISSTASGEIINAWCETFLALEASGWKGSRKTAIHQDKHQTAFFKDLITRCVLSDRIIFSRIKLDGSVIASRVCLLSCDNSCSTSSLPSTGQSKKICGFAFKTAYSEEYKQLSPGVQHELLLIKEIFKRREISAVDSCAIPNHPMIDRIWGERKQIASLIISSDKLVSKFGVQTLKTLKSAKHYLRKFKYKN